MKTHPPVDAGKVSAGEPVKQFRCGKCKKTFVKGRGHNARTCGKTSHTTPKKESVPQLENLTPPTGVKRTTSISEVDTLLQQKLKKGEEVPRKPQRTVDEDGTVRWTLDGKLHRLDGPAVAWVDFRKAWWVDGVETEHPDLCEKAFLPDLTDEEFYELCSHEDYVVRQLAADNPHCPVEWRTMVEIMGN